MSIFGNKANPKQSAKPEVAAPLTPEEAKTVKKAIEPGVVVRPVATVENLEHAKQDEAIATSHRKEAEEILAARENARNEFSAKNEEAAKALREKVTAAVREFQDHQKTAASEEARLRADINESAKNVTEKTSIAESATKVRSALELALEEQNADVTKDAQLAEIQAREAEAEARIKAAQDELAALRQNASNVIAQTEELKNNAKTAQAALANDPNVARLLNVDPNQVVLDPDGVLKVRDEAAAKEAALREKAEEMTDTLLRDADALGRILDQADAAGNKADIAQGVLDKSTPVVPVNPDAASFVDVAADGSIHPAGGPAIAGANNVPVADDIDA